MSPRVLLIGGHGKVSLYMTPLLLSRSWQVTSLIRNPAHADDVRSAAGKQPGQLDILERSLGEVKSEKQAQSILDEAKPDYVVWSAGAGGKGGAEATYAVDRDAARHFITASAHTPSITRFLMVSYIGSRRNRAPWWNDDDWAATLKVNNEILPDYAKAKVEADECLTALATQRGKSFRGIVLRPGTLKDDKATGKIVIGKVRARGDVTRADVADVAARLLADERSEGYYDLLNGDDGIEEAIEKVLKGKVDCIEGEDVEGMVEKYRL